MSEARDAEAAALRTFHYDQVKTLYDYTKFHIGLFLTLGTILVAAIGAKEPIQFNRPLMWVAVILIAIAGLSGGIIASTLPTCSSLGAFLKTPIGPWSSKLLTGERWTRVEHTSFWIGIVAGLAAVGVTNLGFL